MSQKLKHNRGYCVICEQETIFIEIKPWLRDNYRCEKCRSIPRNRAIINALNLFFPQWKKYLIHESSPSGVSSNYIASKCKGYTMSQYFKNVPLGKFHTGVRCENLESLTFRDQSFDLIITQDVFEHVMNPDKAFKEISRVLKPGGAHVFTMPWYYHYPKTIQRARMDGGQIEYLEKPIYHGNPIDAKGSLVTFDWGADFIDFIYKHSKMYTTVYLQKDRTLGLDAEFLHVFISKKNEKSV
ncbi:MAG: class I SAM-dependent methyltransferase [Bacillota bacterium]